MEAAETTVTERDRIVAELDPKLGQMLRDVAAKQRRTIAAQLEVILEFYAAYLEDGHEDDA